MNNAGDAQAEAPRVFISYPRELAKEADALRSRLTARGLASVSSAESDDAEAYAAVREAMRSTELFLVLIAPNAPLNHQQQFEASQMLQRAWTSSGVSIVAVAPAVRAIPPALRHKPFLKYFPQEDVRFNRWAREPAAADELLDGLFAPSSDTGRPETTSQDVEIAEWRNRVIHLGRQGSPFDDTTQQDLRSQLAEDLNRLERSEPADPDPRFREWLMDRTLLAEALGEKDLAREFYLLLSKYPPAAESGRSPKAADRSYAAGLAAFGVADYGVALDHFRRAVKLNLETRAPTDARNVAALHCAGLAAAQMGRSDEATALYGRALQAAKEGLGTHHPQTAAIASDFATLLADVGDTEAATTLLRLAEEAYEKAEPGESQSLLNVRLALQRLGS